MIYEVSWYNEDAYGWMDSISIIFQSKEALFEPKIYELAINKIKENNPDIDFDKWEHTEVLNITDNEVILIRYGGLMS